MRPATIPALVVVVGVLLLADLLLVNEVEAISFGGGSDLAASIAPIRGALPPAATLVVKRGAAGACAWRGAETASFAAPPITVADSIGAGDIFNAGFLAAELAGRDLQSALRGGVEFASAVIATRPRTFTNAAMAPSDAL